MAESSRYVCRKVQDDADGIKEVGKLPSLFGGGDPTYFSQNNPANVQKLPNVFALYRLSVDSRFDNTYQIQTKVSTGGQYEMKQIDNKLLQLAPSHTDVIGYFPSNIQNASTLTALQCKEACNKSPSHCAYYYSYTTDKGSSPKCVLDTTGLPPIYNQTRVSDAMDVGSGTLSLRNKQLKETQLRACASQQIQPDIQNTDDYSRNFKFNNYEMTSSTIDNINDLGVCGSSKYLEYVKQAQDILYHAHEYKPDGIMVTEGLAVGSTADTRVDISCQLY